MITLIDALDANSKEEYWEYSRTLDAAPRAYRRALATYRCIETRHPWNQQVALTPREGVAPEGFNTVNFVLYSRRGVFNMRAYELIIPVFEREGIIYLDKSQELATLKTTSSHREDEGYLYVYPIPVRAALTPLKEALVFIAEVAAAKADLIPKVWDQQGWLYPGAYEQSPEEILGWYFKDQEARFIEEAATARQEPYLAFTVDPNEKDSRNTIMMYRTKMVVLGERLREASPAPWTPNREFPERSTTFFDRLNEIPFGETLNMFDALRVFNGGDELADDLRKMSFATATHYECTKSNGYAYVRFYGLYGVGDGYWKDISFRARLSIDIDGNPVVGGMFSADLAHGEDVDCVDVPERMSLGILRNCLVKRGIQRALSLELIEEDQRGNLPVPLNEAEMTYEEYLKLGIAWLKDEFEAVEELPDDDNNEDEEEASDTPLADWERELLEGEGK